MATTSDEPTTTPEPYRITPQAYLVRERAAEDKSEYLDGEIVAMGGAPEPHVTISANVLAHLYFRLGSGCRVYQSELRVQADVGDGFRMYPDVMVICGAPKYTDAVRDMVTNPTVVFEVLSPSTERHDRGKKARAYQQIPSLEAYVFISQKEPRVEVYSRAAGGVWPCAVYRLLEDVVRLEAIGCELTLAEIYKYVFPVPTDGGPDRG